MTLDLPSTIGIISFAILAPSLIRTIIMLAKRLTWDEIAIRIVCRAKSEKERDTLLKRVDEAAKKGNKTVKLPSYIMEAK